MEVKQAIRILTITGSRGEVLTGNVKPAGGEILSAELVTKGLQSRGESFTEEKKADFQHNGERCEDKYMDWNERQAASLESKACEGLEYVSGRLSTEIQIPRAR